MKKLYTLLFCVNRSISAQDNTQNEYQKKLFNDAQET
jgi:hypothetical protein